MKPGHKTTEFAFVILFLVLQGLGLAVGFIHDPMLASIAGSVVLAAYSIARGLAKQNSVEVPADLLSQRKGTK